MANLPAYVVHEQKGADIVLHESCPHSVTHSNSNRHASVTSPCHVLTSADREVRYLLEVEDVLFVNLIGELAEPGPADDANHRLVVCV